MTPIFAAGIPWGAATRTPRLGYARARGRPHRARAGARRRPGGAGRAAAKPRLKAFDSCAGLVRYAQRNADRLPSRPSARRSPVAAPEAGDDHSTTNVQEGGVDEPDTVKTDGRRLFVVAGGSLHVIDARARPPRLLDSLSAAAGHAARAAAARRPRAGADPARRLRDRRAGTDPARLDLARGHHAVRDRGLRRGRLRLVRTLEADGSLRERAPHRRDRARGHQHDACRAAGRLCRARRSRARTAASVASAGSCAAAPSATRASSPAFRWSRCSRSTWRRACPRSTPTR